jgi:hypothetical protein
MAKRMIYESQIELSAAASTPKEAVRKQEHDAHVNDVAIHLEPGGQVGQVYVRTATGYAWKWPKVICSCGPASISFEETSLMAVLQGIDFNAVREVEIV